MQLKILLPTELFLNKAVTKIIAHDSNGAFCLLPRHIDFVTALVPGLLYYETSGGEKVYLALDQGTMVKSGKEVHVSVRNAAGGADLGSLQQTVTKQFQHLDDQEKETRSAIARLEANFIRKFTEFEQ